MHTDTHGKKYTRRQKNTHGYTRRTKNTHGERKNTHGCTQIHTGQHTHGGEKYTRTRYTRNTHGNVTKPKLYANTHENTH